MDHAALLARVRGERDGPYGGHARARVAQEAPTNAARHAEADAVRFALGTEEGKLMLTVADDGRGFDPARAGAGAGIRGMRERALLVRAELEIESAPGAGTTVRLRMPA